MQNTQLPMQSDPLVPTSLTVGAKVTYTNEFGVSFSGFTVQGFSVDKNAPETAYVDSDCYWFPKPFNSLTIEAMPNFLFLENCELSVEHLVNRAMAFSKPISQVEFDNFMTENKISTGRARSAHSYLRLGNVEMAETFAKAEFKKPRLGVSDGTLGRNGCLTLLVELGAELLVYDAGRAWNSLL
ncbi:MAG: hypothetical protein EOP04_18820, partial [Proteobacteria bacterium]